MKLFLISVTMLVVVVVNSHHGGQREPPEPNPPYGSDYQTQPTNAPLESKYTNEITLASPEISDKDFNLRQKMDVDAKLGRKKNTVYAEYPGKYYTGEDCSGGSGSYPFGTVDSCKSECALRDDCNAFWFTESQGCTIFDCPVPIPAPSGTNSQRTAYAIIPDYEEYPNKLYSNDDCPNRLRYLPRVSLETCKIECAKDATCNAFHRYPYWGCSLLNCPFPVPLPSWTDSSYTAYSMIIPDLCFRGQCLTINEDMLTWSQAVAACKAKGHRLAVLQDPTALHAYLKRHHGGRRFWLGGSDSEIEGTWTWINGQSLTSINRRSLDGFTWPPGQPSNSGSGQDCLEWGFANNYNDNWCNQRQRYLSELDPCSSVGGSSVSGKCIFINGDPKTWPQAVAACEANNQQLAVLQDPEAFHAYMLMNHKGEKYWLGASDKDHEGTWTLDNGRSLAGLPWGPGQPNGGTSQNCLEWGYNNNYNDYRCNVAQRYVCETVACADITCKATEYSDCGISTISVKGIHFPRIIGGEAADIGEYPWQVGLKIMRKDRSGTCGGSIINKHWILTAAHCLAPTPKDGPVTSLKIYLGTTKLQPTPNSDILYYTQKEVEELVDIHEFYIAEKLYHDIALIELKKDLVFTDSIRPVCLADDKDYKAGQSAIATGWGVTDAGGNSASTFLNELATETIEDQDCFEKSKFTMWAPPWSFCTFTNKKGPCEGDSGGPLIVQHDGHWIQIGIASWGHCGQKNMPKDGPAGWVKVAKYRTYIDLIMNPSKYHCECKHYGDGNGCRISKASNHPKLACQCSEKCEGTVVPCKGKYKSACENPKEDYKSCVEGGGACTGYCDCNHYWGTFGGCSISLQAPEGFACKCSSTYHFSCSGIVVKCPVREDCSKPDISEASCLQGGGNCGGY